MLYDNSLAVQNLIPKGYSFDAYNELNSRNTRDRPFFESSTIKLGNYYLNKKFENNGDLILEFSSVCPNGAISFEPYKLSLNNYVELLRKALDEKSDFITFEIPITYKTCPYSTRCTSKNKDCSYLLKNCPSFAIAAVSFETSDIKNALSVYFGIEKQSKGGSTMKTNMKKLFGMNFEFGMSKDPNIAATFMGVAVRNSVGGDWYIFDQATHTLKNYANMKFGDFKVFLLPTNALQPGDLTKMDGNYYYVQEIEGSYITLLGAADGIVVRKLLTECIIPGMNFYTKVVALDPRTLFDPSSQTNMSNNVIAALCMMNWSKGKSEFSLDDIDDDSFNGLGMLLMMGGTNGLGNMFGNNGDGGMNLPLLMMMGSGNESDEANDVVQYMLLNQILNGGNANAALTANMPNLFGTATPTPVATIPDANTTGNAVYCPVCGIDYPDGTNFCTKCGAHTEVKGKHCTACGTILPDGALFCPNCGQKVVKDTCPQCGKKIAEGANFCAACGHKLNEAKKVTPKTTYAKSGTKKNGRKSSKVTTPVESQVPVAEESPVTSPVEE